MQAMLSFNTFDFQLVSRCSAYPVKSLAENEEPERSSLCLVLKLASVVFGSLSRATLIALNTA